jgi:hypothetical protein
MSKGNPQYKVRLIGDIARKVEATIQLRNDNSREEPWTVAAFIRAAIIEKISKMDRSRRRKIEGYDPDDYFDPQYDPTVVQPDLFATLEDGEAIA